MYALPVYIIIAPPFAPNHVDQGGGVEGREEVTQLITPGLANFIAYPPRDIYLSLSITMVE